MPWGYFDISRVFVQTCSVDNEHIQALLGLCGSQAKLWLIQFCEGDSQKLNMPNLQIIIICPANAM